MLLITIAPVENWDEINNLFITSKKQELQLEHSLVSLSRWESKWLKPFLSKTVKTLEETEDYVRCMTINQNVDPEIYKYISARNIDEVNAYIDSPMTATTFSKSGPSPMGRDVITAEIIYYWMVRFNIPFECQKWHLNRLLTLINVCNIKEQPAKKVSTRETMAKNKALNDARRAALNTSG